MTRVVHLLVGPDGHGVVRHGGDIAEACGHEVLRAHCASEMARVPPCDVVHLPFTDRLLAADLDAAADVARELVAAVRAAGAELSVTLHDLPHDDSDLQRRRRELYRWLVEQARGVVVNSRTELDLLELLGPRAAAGVHSLRMIPLPLYPAPAELRGETPEPTVAVLGFVFPDRGYDEVIAALPPHARVLAIGRASAGHDDLGARYAEAARGRWELTGYVPDHELPDRLWSAAVPIAPNRRVTASASINTWIAHGRRPLVPDSPHGREVLARFPGCVTLYDPDDPQGLPAALRAALADPASTWLDLMPAPDLHQAATDYAQHLHACAAPRPQPVPGGLAVPGNRWDLLPGDAAPGEAVPLTSVVIPYYEDQPRLDLVLAALTTQTLARERFEVIVADDGSPVPPDLSRAAGLRVRTVRQDDLGFRAAAARNLGARAAEGAVLVFLDADTVPEPDFLRQLVQGPSSCPDLVAVGRRRHGDFAAAVDDSFVADWRDGWRPAELDEPGWLRDAYRDSGDLLAVDRRSYRFVISAVLGVPAALFARIGGFDERFVGYGGEDWDLAHRAYVDGAVVSHVPAAVAWHDGPDWGARGDAEQRRRAKNRETAALAALLPDPDSRGPGVWGGYPSVVVCADRMHETDAIATVRSAAHCDCRFWFGEIASAESTDRSWVLDDPRVRVGCAVPAGVLARAWCVVQLHGPADLTDLMSVADSADRHGHVESPALSAWSSRSLNRSRRWSGDSDDSAALADRWFGRHDLNRPATVGEPDLAGQLRDAGRSR